MLEKVAFQSRTPQCRVPKFIDAGRRKFHDVVSFFPSFNPAPATSYLILFAPGRRPRRAAERNTTSRTEMEVRSMEVEGGDC